jgi:hypothetical protein
VTAFSDFHTIGDDEDVLALAFDPALRDFSGFHLVLPYAAGIGAPSLTVRFVAKSYRPSSRLRHKESPAAVPGFRFPRTHLPRESPAKPNR